MSRIVTLSRCRTNLIWLETGTLPCFFYGATDGHPTTHSFLSGKKYFSEEESLAMTSHSLKAPPCYIQHPLALLPLPCYIQHPITLLPPPCYIQHPITLLPLPCSVHALYTHPVAPHNNNLRFLRLYSVLPPSLTLPPPPAP